MEKDDTVEIRKAIVKEINKTPKERDELEAIYGKVWDTEELRKDFHVKGFLAPFIAVERRSDKQEGAILFQHWPRYYFNYEDL